MKVWTGRKGPDDERPGKIRALREGTGSQRAADARRRASEHLGGDISPVAFAVWDNGSQRNPTTQMERENSELKKTLVEPLLKNRS
jgi:hypothetical protein